MEVICFFYFDGIKTGFGIYYFRMLRHRKDAYTYKYSIVKRMKQKTPNKPITNSKKTNKRPTSICGAINIGDKSKMVYDNL
jgi:hypothetical protein